MDALDAYWRDIKKYPRFSKEEEVEFFNNLDIFKKRKSEYINSRLKYVFVIAKKLHRYLNLTNIDALDLIEEGNIGLLECLNKFDISKCHKNSTRDHEQIVRSFNCYLKKSTRGELKSL